MANPDTYDMKAPCLCGHTWGGHAPHGNNPCKGMNCYVANPVGDPCSCKAFTPVKDYLQDKCAKCSHTREKHLIPNDGKTVWTKASEGCLVDVPSVSEPGMSFYCECSEFVEPEPVKADAMVDPITGLTFHQESGLALLKQAWHVGIDIETTAKKKKEVTKSLAFGMAYGTGPKVPMTLDPSFGKVWKGLKSDHSKFLIHDDVVAINEKGFYSYVYGGYNATLPDKEHFSAHELKRARTYMMSVTGITSMQVNGTDLEHLMAGYASMVKKDIQDHIDERVAEGISKELQNKHKHDCIPSFKKNARKFRA